MTHWTHLTEVPDPIRATMAKTFMPWEKADLGVDSMVNGIYQDPTVTELTGRALRASANRTRVPLLVKAVTAAHPTLSRRSVFCAVSLFLGLHEKHVQDLVYRFKRRSYGPTAR